MSVHDLIRCTCGHARHHHEHHYVNFFGHPATTWGKCTEKDCDCQQFQDPRAAWGPSAA